MSFFLVLAAAVVLGVLVVTAVFQVLWNMTMPDVFGLKPIAYWVAFRLLLIGACLTSGFGLHLGWGR